MTTENPIQPPAQSEPQAPALALNAGSASEVNRLINELESRGLGWSLDHTGNLIEARVWAWPHVVGRYRPAKLEPLERMLAQAMYQVEWGKYPVLPNTVQITQMRSPRCANNQNGPARILGVAAGSALNAPMQFNISKDWIMKQASSEEGQNIEAGQSPLSREQWIAEVRRLLVAKYEIKWPAEEVAEYAESLAGTYYDDADWRETPDGAIQDDFSYGL